MGPPQLLEVLDLLHEDDEPPAERERLLGGLRTVVARSLPHQVVELRALALE